jgi:hypothetical protein
MNTRNSKNRIVIILIFGLCIVVILFWIWNKGQKKAASPTTIVTDAPLANARTNAGDRNLPNLPPSQDPTVPPAGLAEQLGISQDGLNSLITQWSSPIEFYGKVIDDSRRPVSEATINFSANDLSPDGRSTYKKVSDKDGLFSITGIRGKFLHVRVSKPGYQTSKSDQITFSYAGGDTDQITPDQNNPVLFHLYKVKVSDSNAIPCSLPVKLPIDGRLVGIDLVSCRLVSPDKGHLVLNCKSSSRTPEKNGKFSWEVTITVPQGGVIAGPNEVNFEAPETGYTDSLTIRHSPDDSDWRLDLNSDFFAKLSDGSFVRLHMFIFGNNGRGQFQALRNPPGIREFGELPP